MSIEDISSTNNKLEESWSAARSFWQDDDGDNFERRGVRTVLDALERGLEANYGFKRNLSNADDRLRALVQEAMRI